jgi:hypothetical protein
MEDWAAFAAPAVDGFPWGGGAAGHAGVHAVPEQHQPQGSANMPSIVLMAFFVSANDFWALTHPEIQRLPPLAVAQSWRYHQEDCQRTIKANLATSKGDAYEYWKGLERELGLRMRISMMIIKFHNRNTEVSVRNMCLQLLQDRYPDAYESGNWPTPVP